MKVLFITLLFGLCCSTTASGVPKSKVLKCAVCRSLVTELHHEMDNVDPRRKIKVGSFRLESDGKQKTTSRPYAGSEAHMTDVLESVCQTFKDHAQAKNKETGRLEVIAIVGKDGKMNPRFSDYEMIQDPDLNKGLEYHCQSIVEDFEEDIVSYFGNVRSDLDIVESQNKFCDKTTKICKGVRDEL